MLAKSRQWSISRKQVNHCSWLADGRPFRSNLLSSNRDSSFLPHSSQIPALYATFPSKYRTVLHAVASILWVEGSVRKETDVISRAFVPDTEYRLGQALVLLSLRIRKKTVCKLSIRPCLEPLIKLLGRPRSAQS